jgi:hypothetical protein
MATAVVLRHARAETIDRPVRMRDPGCCAPLSPRIFSAGAMIGIAPKGNTARCSPLQQDVRATNVVICRMINVHGQSGRKRRALFHSVAAALLVAGAVIATTPVAAQGNTMRAGTLTCRTSGSVGLVVGSRQRLACQFVSDRGARQNYTGTIGRLGLDLGVTAGGVLVWAVLASTANIPSGALAGEFVGASGDISVGVGVGANVLVGGTRKSISLQPVSLEGQVGANLAVGVARMRLTPAS